MIRYYKLFDMLNRRGMKKTDLDLSSKTIAKLSKGANLNTDIIDKICMQLNCQPADIMEYVASIDQLSDEEIKENAYKQMVKMLPGISVPVIKKHIEIPIEEPTWEELLTEEAFQTIWNRYEIYHNAISEDDFKDILIKCIDKRRKGELKINEEKLLKLLKTKADLSKLNL